MLPLIEAKYASDLAFIQNVFVYYKNKDQFASELHKFDANSLKTYVVLAAYHIKSQHEEKIPLDLQMIFDPDGFFEKLNKSEQLLQREPTLSNYLVDAFEVMTVIGNRTIDAQFYAQFHANLRIALMSEQVNIISIYLQILHRLDDKSSEILTPPEILETIIAAVHGHITDQKLLNEALLLVESNVVKRHNLDASGTQQLLDYMWHHLCSASVAKHQCDNCYNILSQLIQVYMSECQRSDAFARAFLSGELWQFVRAAIESKNMTRRKQAIYILQNILEKNEKAVMGADEQPADSEDRRLIWKNYFAVLESLLELQCNLISKCLDQYLDGIVKHLPPFWYSIIFALVLRHHNYVIIHYGIEFILRHGISLQHDNHLMNGFYQALNNTYLHCEAKISEQHLAKYFQESDMNHTLDIMMLIITWQPVPLWTVLKSLDIFVQSNKDCGYRVEMLLNFLKRSVAQIKNMPEVDDMTVSILQNIGINNLSLEQVLALYDVIQRKEILDGYNQPLNLRTFELNFIKLHQISIDTKINYFEHAIPNVIDRLKFLDEFYGKNRTMIHYFPHYEYLLSKSLCEEKSLQNALFVIKPRIYNLTKPNGSITIEAISFATSLLKFIVDKFIDDACNSAVFDSINKTVINFHEVFRKKLYTDNCTHPMKIQQTKDQLNTISMQMTKCSELYPNKMAVLGVLADVIMMEDEKIDLSRFNTEDEDDVRAMQGLYDCFIDKSHEFKQSHQAYVVSKILSTFPQLELDIWKAYKILLAGKVDISCIFALQHSYCIKEIDGVLADALLYGNELKGEEKQAYEFISSKSSSMTYNQKVRLSAMRSIAAKNHLDQIRNIKDVLFARNVEIYRVRYYTNSYHHMMKLRITQALAFLFRMDPIWDDRMLKIILDEANQTNVTHINELIIGYTIEPSKMLSFIGNIEGNKGLQSMFMTIYYACSKQPENVSFAKQCIEFLIKYIFVKQIIVRTTAQIVLIKLCEKFHLVDEFKILYDSTKIAHEVKVSRALKFSYAYKYRFEQIDSKRMLHTMYTLREIPRITRMISDEYYKHEIWDAEDATLAIQMNEDDALTSQESVDVELGFIDNAEDTIANAYGGGVVGGNVQRKLVTYRETFIDRQILNSLSDEFTRRETKIESDLIILCSLLTKPANLGGLSRSSEVFGVKAVAIDNLKHQKHNDFTSISMASEKWLKFLEVKQHSVATYLIAMKANGYAIVGAEQTAFGNELHKAQLPKKMVLVLGHEKDGIPANILNLLDMAIEIPQFGVVRSLNVHVSASIFMWEYCKQHLIVDSDVSR